MPIGFLPLSESLRRGSILWIFSLFFFFSLSSAQATKRYVKVFFPNGFSVTAELAETDAERRLGLMFRSKIYPDQGMLFILEEEGYHSFWMKNMKFPLDILWLDREKRIIHMETRVPPCRKDPCPAYTPPLPAAYVLEIKAGSIEKNGLKLSDRLEFILPERPGVP